MNWKTTVGYKSHGKPATAAAVSELEAQIGVPLPADYRDFLLSDGGGYVREGLAECTMPTPFGRHNITQLSDILSVVDLLDSSVVPRNMIAIGFGHFGMTTCLSLSGLDHGQIFSLDTEMRFYWDDETIAKFPSLDQSIREFFRMRDNDELPARPWGYDNCYHVSTTFISFLNKLYVEP